MSVDGIVWDSWKTWWDSIWPHGFNMFQSMDGTRQVEPVEGSKPKMKRGLEGAGERQCGLWEWYYGKRWQANKMVFRDLKQQNGRRSCKNLASWNGQQWDRYIYIFIYIRLLTRYVIVMTSIDQHQQTSLDQVILSMGLLISAPPLDRLVFFHTPKLCGLPCESSDSW